MAALINERHEELTSVEQFLEYARLDKQADGYLRNGEPGPGGDLESGVHAEDGEGWAGSE